MVQRVNTEALFQYVDRSARWTSYQSLPGLLGMSVSLNCCLCSRFSKTRDHLLLWCEFSEAVWNLIRQKLGQTTMHFHHLDIYVILVIAVLAFSIYYKTIGLTSGCLAYLKRKEPKTLQSHLIITEAFQGSRSHYLKHDSCKTAMETCLQPNANQAP